MSIPARPGPPDRRRALGSSGEKRVAMWYEQRGYEVVDRNWRSRQGEIDLVLRHSGTVVFCEVKTRRGLGFGEPFEAVTPAKRARLRRLAAEWLRERRAPATRRGSDVIRFDVASVVGDDVRVIEEAF